MSSENAQLENYRTRLIRALVVLQVMVGLANGSTIAIGSLLASSIGGDVWGGMASTLSTIGSALFAIPLASLVTARGRRASMSLGIVIGLVGAVSAIAAGELNSLILALLAFALIGAAGAVNFQSRFVAADVSIPSRRGRNLSLVIWSTTIGAVAGPNLLPLGAKLGNAFGLEAYSGTYLIVMIAQVAALVIIEVALRPDPARIDFESGDLTERALPAKGAAGRGAKKHGAAAIDHSYDAQAFLPIAAIALAHFTMIALMSMTAVHLQGHGASITIIGLTVSLHILGMYGFSPIFGFLSDKIGRMNTLLVGNVMLGLSAILVIARDTLPVTITAMILLGLGWSAALVASSAMLTDSIPAEHRTVYQGRSDFTMNIMGALGGVIAGPIVTIFSMQILGVVSLIVVIGITILQFTWRPKRK